MDPWGFALENLDAVGAGRTEDGGQLIEAGAVLADGTAFKGFSGLQQILLDRREEFARAFTERLMTYALGRGLVAQDMPAVRAIAREAAKDDWRVQTRIRGIGLSPVFTVLRVAGPTPAGALAAGCRAPRRSIGNGRGTAARPVCRGEASNGWSVLM